MFKKTPYLIDAVNEFSDLFGLHRCNDYWTNRHYYMYIQLHTQHTLHACERKSKRTTLFHTSLKFPNAKNTVNHRGNAQQRTSGKPWRAHATTRVIVRSTWMTTVSTNITTTVDVGRERSRCHWLQNGGQVPRFLYAAETCPAPPDRLRHRRWSARRLYPRKNTIRSRSGGSRSPLERKLWRDAIRSCIRCLYGNLYGYTYVQHCDNILNCAVLSSRSYHF